MIKRKLSMYYVLVLITFAFLSLLVFNQQVVYAKPIEKIDELINFETKATFSDVLNGRNNSKESDLGKVKMQKNANNTYNIYIEYNGEKKQIQEQEIPYVGKDNRNNKIYPNRIDGYFYTEKMVSAVIENGDLVEKASNYEPYIAYTMNIDISMSNMKQDYKSGEIKSFNSWTFWNLRTGKNYTQDSIKFWGYVSEENTKLNYTRADAWNLEKRDPKKYKKLVEFNNNRSNYKGLELAELDNEYKWWFGTQDANIKDYYLNLATPYPMQNLTMIKFNYDRTSIAARKEPDNPNSGYLNPNIVDNEEKDVQYIRRAGEKVITKAPELTEEFISLSYTPLIQEGQKLWQEGKQMVISASLMATFKLMFSPIGPLIALLKGEPISDDIKKAELGRNLQKSGLRLVEQGNKSILASRILNQAIKDGKLQHEVAQIEKVFVDSPTDKLIFANNYNKNWDRENAIKPLLPSTRWNVKYDKLDDIFGMNDHYFKIYLDTITNTDYVAYKYKNLRIIELTYELFNKEKTVKSDYIDENNVIDNNEDPEQWNLDPNYEENKKIRDEARKKRDEIKKQLEEINKRQAQARQRRKWVLYGGIILLGVSAIVVGIILIKLFFPSKSKVKIINKIKKESDDKDENID